MQEVGIRRPRKNDSQAAILASEPYRTVDQRAGAARDKGCPDRLNSELRELPSAPLRTHASANSGPQD